MKRRIKMIATDLDGTLLRDDKTISEYTKAVLNRCREAGIKVVYATGRGGSASRVVPSDMFDGRITMNGAIGIAGDTEVYNRLVPYEAARPVLLACHERGLKTTSELSGMHYSNFDVNAEWPFITNFEIVDFAHHALDAEKLYAVVQSPDDATFIEKLLPPELYLTVSRDGLAQVMHKDATKSKALAALAQVWGIAPAEIVAFGDDSNDIDMLIYVGVGVAMGNAVDVVKAVCEHSALSNEEDGLAGWVVENVLGTAT